MGQFNKFIIPFACAFFAFAQSVYSEGSRQLSPTANDIVLLHTNASGFANFAAYDGDPLSRLNIHIEDFSTETVYIGLSAEADNNGNLTPPGTFWFRIKDPDGVVVHGPFQVTTSNDNAETWALATAGPDVIDPVNGYQTAGVNYAVFDPSTVGKNGDYYIEFSESQNAPQNNIINILWYDFTVVAGGTEQPGRLWSNRWALRTPQETGAAPECEWDRPFNGQFYSYTIDGFVSLVDFSGSGFQGLSFTVAFGEFGPGNTGNVIEDRKSVNIGDSTATAADHQVFLNDPDPSVYPSSPDICGTAEYFGASCEGDDICISVGITQEGQVEVLLDFFGDNGIFDPNTTDVLLAEVFFAADTACIPWDGLKGDGSPLDFNEQVEAVIRYSQGIQHYAAYDVEFLQNGFCVQTIRPTCSGMSNLLYWDDSNITDFVSTPTIDESDPGTGQPLVQLSGCTCGAGGCRTWNNFQTGTNPNDCDGPPAGYGDERTLNTWWFAASVTVGPVNIPVLQVMATGDTLICSGDSTALSVVTSLMDPGYTYSWSGPGGFTSDMQNPGFASEPGDYIVTVMDPATGCMATDTITIEVAPEIMTTLDFTCVMANQPNADIDLSVSGGIAPYSFLWSNGAMTEDLTNVPAGFYSVTVTDDLGCEATDTITVQGCCMLEFLCPPPVTDIFACITDIPAQDTAQVFVTDFCEPLMIEIVDANNGGTGCEGDTLVVTRTYFITDGAGNSGTCTQTIDIVDDQPPIPTGGSCPQDTSILCGQPAGTDLLGLPSYVDICTPGVGISVTFRDDSTGFDGTCTNMILGQIQRTFFGEDLCGNIDSTCVQTISVIDTVPPIFTLPPDAIIDCTSDSLTSTTGMVTGVADNCTATTVDFTDLVVPGECPVIDTIYRTWTVTDACGNVATGVQVISRTDTQPPSFIVPGDITINCTQDSLPAITGDVTGILDDCSSTTVEFSDLVSAGTCPVIDVITRTWTVSDACGNATTDVQIITRIDNTDPTFTVPADIVIACDEMPTTGLTGDVTDASDLCSSTSVGFTDITVPGECPATDTIFRTWTVLDACDNSATGVQVITRVDTVAPIVLPGTCPENFTIACNEMPGELGEPGFSDNCTLVTLSIDVDSIGFVPPSSEGVITRTFYLTDACGNVDSSCVQVITVVDNLPPMVTCPPDIEVQCGDDTGPNATGNAQLTDDCGDPLNLELTFTDVTTGFGGGCGAGTIIRTFTGTDPDGNAATCQQNITVTDDIVPVFDVPPSITVDCDIDFDDLSLTGEISNVSDCSAIADTSYSDMSGMISCTGVGEITRTWSVTDACGNVGTAVQMIYIQDTVPPNLIPPPDVVISCEQDPLDTMVTGSIVVVSDACSMNFMLSYEDDNSGLTGCNGTGVIIRRWNASDECGNMAVMEQTITVVDNTPPVPLCNDITLNFYTGEILTISPDDVDNGSSDACGEVSLSLSQSVFDCRDFRNNAVQTAQLIVSDDCGNNAACEFTVTGVGGSGIIASCPTTDIFVHLGSGECEAAVSYPIGGEPECGNFEIVVEQIDDSGYTSGDIFPIGDYVQEYIIYNVPDASAPADLVPDTVSCAFNIHVIENIQTTNNLNCNGNVNISFDQNCELVINPDMILEGGNYSCFDDFFIEIEDVAEGFGEVMITIDDVVLGQYYTVTITDTKTGISCWNKVRFEYKFPPFTECGDRTILCTTPLHPVFTMPDGEMLPYAPSAGSDCVEIMYDWEDEVFEGLCGVDSVYRSWTITDEVGNAATCVQRIFVQPATFDSLEFPATYFGPCDGSTDPSVTGYPLINGESIVNNPQCNIMAVYDDVEFEECGASTKVVRKWRVLNWCTQETIEGNQVIKLLDEEGPEVVCPADIEVGTDFWFCHANVPIPPAQAFDACGSDPITFELASSAGEVTQVGGQYVVTEMPLGTNQVTWTAIDDCGNTSSCTIQVTVKDDVPPVVNCDEHTVVSLTNDRPFGITLVDASVLDDGSYDNCSEISFRARRMTSCINIDWTSNGAGIDDIPNGIVNSRDRGTVHRPKIPFACCDVAAGPIMVELEVTDEVGNINYCMVEVTVQDKIAPYMECPPDIVVSCDFWFDDHVTTNQFIDLSEDPLGNVFGTMLDAFENTEEDRRVITINDPGRPTSPSDPDYLAQPYDWGRDGWAFDNCDIELDVFVTIVEDCSGEDPAIPDIPSWLISADRADDEVKYIKRRFRATDLSPQENASTCEQNIWVVDFDPFYISDNTCTNTDPRDGVIWPCDLEYTTCPDSIDYTEPVIFDDNCSLIGITYDDSRFDFVDSACYKILREWTIIDWCQYNAATGAGLWKYTQVIKVIDSDGPEVINCPEGPVTLCASDPGVSLPDNNQVFLSEEDPDHTSCSVHIDVSLDVQELCSDYVIYDVKVYPFNGIEFLQLVDKTEVALDEAGVAILNLNTRNAAIPAIRQNGLPYNSPFCGDYHRVLWSIEDGCGNLSTCEYLLRLEDCKQPSPVCINGLSTVVMPQGGSVTIWAKEYDASSIDDCTPAEDLLFSFSGDFHQPSMEYNCENVPAFGAELEVQIWVADAGVDADCDGTIDWDEKNRDFCTTTIVVTDNEGVCGSGTAVIEGDVLTHDVQEPVAQTTVSLQHPSQAFPSVITAEDGKYAFTGVPANGPYTITPLRNDDHKNGVSTLDLVRIQKHLLGVEPFTSPYQYIAADANNSQSVSVIDLIELRKLILQMTTELPNNTSWRFAANGQEFADLSNPWPFEESITLETVEAGQDYVDENFMAIKVGDLNNTVVANATQVVVRNPQSEVAVEVISPEALIQGEIYELEVIVPAELLGFQWTMDLRDLDFIGIESDQVGSEDYALHDRMLAMSFVRAERAAYADGGPEPVKFRLIVQASTSGQAAQMIGLSDEITPVEGYRNGSGSDGAIEVVELALDFGSQPGSAEYALFQNQPNPFVDQTIIGFTLPGDMEATITVFDAAGKVLRVIEGDYARGYNKVAISSGDLPAGGVAYYNLKAGAFSATRKMILIK